MSCMTEICVLTYEINILYSTVMGSTVRQSRKMKGWIRFDDHSNGAETYVLDLIFVPVNIDMHLRNCFKHVRTSFRFVIR